MIAVWLVVCVLQVAPLHVSMPGGSEGADVHDLAVTGLKVPKKVKLKPSVGPVTKLVKVKVQNRSAHEETIPDLATLAELVQLEVESLGDCPAPLPVLVDGKPNVVPRTVKSRKSFTVAFRVTFDCANDPLKGAGHEDFSYEARVDHAALDGIPDSHGFDDSAPRPALPGLFDPNPDGKIKDKGVGGKLPDKTLGGPVLTDVDSRVVSGPDVPELALTVETGTEALTIELGSVKNVASVITLTNTSGSTRVATVITDVPADDALIVASDQPPQGYVAVETTTFLLNQAIFANAIGTHVLANTATIAGTAISAQDSLTVHVVPPGGDPVILPLGAVPDGVSTDAESTVLFSATIASYLTPPDQLDLQLVDGPVVGALRDDGTGGDLAAGDGVYSGSVPVTSGSEGVIAFRAVAQFPGTEGERASPDFELVVTCFPATVAAVDLSAVVADPVTQQDVVCGEVLVTFTGPKSCAEVEAFAAAFGASVVGTLPGLGLYQLSIPNPGCSAEVLNDTIAAMTAVPGVARVSPDVLLELTAVTPNDPGFTEQYALTTIRADEAWVLARGGPVIAIVDSGVDDTHPDLVGRVDKGPDHVDDDDDPLDSASNGHGTHGAGIAAAIADNGVFIAGVAPDSRILAVRITNGIGKGSSVAATAGIRSASALGARIINCSWAFETNVVADFLGSLDDAVDEAVARGALVVAAAGNEETSSLGNPARFEDVLCVGATIQGDGKLKESNFGPLVDLAAPGLDILSLEPGGSSDFRSGTSSSAPLVAGCAAVVWSRFPELTAQQVRERLLATALPLPGLQLGAGRVDLFEAVFNGSFEADVDGWLAIGTTGSMEELGQLPPTHGARLGFLSSGPDGSLIESSLEQTFTIQPGVTSLPIRLDYDFVTEEFPEFVGTQFNDSMRIVFVAPDGGETELAFESVSASAFTPITGIDFPGGDETVGHTGFQTVSVTLPVQPGEATLRLEVRDEGDGAFDSNVLVDNIRFE